MITKGLPVKKNEHYSMIVDDIGVNGEGIGKVNGYTLFVPGALPGEEIEVRVVKAKKNFGFGKLIEVKKPSQHRIEPICDKSSRCGGCQLGNLSYEAQLDYKTNKVREIIKRIGGFDNPNVLDTIGMQKPYYYRNKAQFPVGRDGSGKLKIGFYAPRSHNIINNDKCYIQHEINEEIVKAVREYINENDISVYDESKHKGVIRHILTKVGYSTNEIMVCVVINGKKLPHKDKFLEKITQIEGMTSVSINFNNKKTNVILGDKTITIWGKDVITDYIGDLKFEISPLSFFQVNPIQTNVLYDKALEFAQLDGDETVWDAYCGIGTISLFLASKAKKVYGVEIIEPAIEDARKNAIRNNINNVEFFVGKAEEVIPEQYNKNNIKADVMVVDPPRKGCDEKLLDTIIDMQPKRVVYVSCDPATLARDIKYLAEKGYTVDKIQPVDMFGWTTHVEVVTVLERQDS